MKKTEIRKIKSVWRYLQSNQSQAFEEKNEIDFDWYGEGLQTLFCVLGNRPIKITPRIKAL